MFKNKYSNILAIFVLSTIGIFTVVLPWINYPTLDLIVYGKEGDGWLISMVFGVSMIISGIAFFRKKTSIHFITRILIGFLSISILSLCIYKIINFHQEVDAFVTDSPIMGYAGSGASLSYGLYVIIVISALTALLCMMQSYFSTFKNILKLIGFTAIVIIVCLFGNKLSYLIGAPEKQDQVINLKSSFDDMSTALVEKTPSKFVEHIHPILYESVGGKTKLAAMMADMYATIEIEKAEIVDIPTFIQKGNNVQALVYQKITFLNNSVSTTTSNLTIAFSYDAGKKWVFAGTENKPFDEMREVLPEIFDELKY